MTRINTIRGKIKQDENQARIKQTGALSRKTTLEPFRWNMAYNRASDFFQDWWAEVTNGAKNGGSFSEMMGPSISN